MDVLDQWHEPVCRILARLNRPVLNTTARYQWENIKPNLHAWLYPTSFSARVSKGAHERIAGILKVRNCCPISESYYRDRPVRLLRNDRGGTAYFAIDLTEG